MPTERNFSHWAWCVRHSISSLGRAVLAGDLLLATHCINGHDTTGQIQRAQQLGDGRNLPPPSAAALRAACGGLSRSARIPNDASCLRLLRALAAEQHEEWLDGARYLDMQPLADRSKTQLQLAA